jgi:cysteinyl-tRNA synthetase
MEVNFDNAMNENFNFPKILGTLSNVFSEVNDLLISKEHSAEDKIYTLKEFRENLNAITNVIKIFDENPEEYITAYKRDFLRNKDIDEDLIHKKIETRNQAKREKDYTLADKLREELKES